MSSKTPASPVLADGDSAPAVIVQFRQWAADIPAGGEETATLSILTQLGGATAPTDLDAPWETAGTDKLAGRVIVADALKRLPSDFTAGLGFFLVVTGHDNETGETFTFTTGSVGIVGALVKAHHEGWLPLRCELVTATRPTKSGYYPQHLRVYGRDGEF